MEAKEKHHNKEAIRHASRRSRFSEISRLFERSGVLDKIVGKYFSSQFQFGTLLQVALILCFGTNQALFRGFRNAIQHFNVEEGNDEVTLFNKKN